MTSIVRYAASCGTPEIFIDRVIELSNVASSMLRQSDNVDHFSSLNRGLSCHLEKK